MESRRPVRNVRTRPTTAKEAGDWGIRVSIPRNQSPDVQPVYSFGLSEIRGIGGLSLSSNEFRKRKKKRARRKQEKKAYPSPNPPRSSQVAHT